MIFKKKFRLSEDRLKVRKGNWCLLFQIQKGILPKKNPKAAQRIFPFRIISFLL